MADIEQQFLFYRSQTPLFLVMLGAFFLSHVQAHHQIAQMPALALGINRAIRETHDIGHSVHAKMFPVQARTFSCVDNDDCDLAGAKRFIRNCKIRKPGDQRLRKSAALGFIQKMNTAQGLLWLFHAPKDMARPK